MTNSFFQQLDKEKEHTAQRRKTYLSDELFQGTREIVIVHRDLHYRLQITKAGKLILNK